MRSGPRRELRPAEALAKLLMPLVGPLLPGRWEEFRGVRAETVAAAILAAARRGRRGVTIHPGGSLRALAG